MENKFGLFAINQNVKVTQDPKIFDKIAKIPCSMGFKDKAGKWVNEWVDVICFKKEQADGIAKGDKIKVTGRLNLSEYENKKGEKVKSWQILVDEIEVTKAEGNTFVGNRDIPEDQDIPF
jgi:single-stranded DNA-binding protein